MCKKNIVYVKKNKKINRICKIIYGFVDDVQYIDLCERQREHMRGERDKHLNI